MKNFKLELVALLTGMAVMMIEIAGVRALAPYLGNTLFTWSASITVILAGLGIGYYVGGKIADFKPDLAILAMLLGGATIFAGIIPIVSHQILNSSIYFGFEFGPLFASIALLALPNVFLGSVSPMLVKIRARGMKEVGGSVGRLYAIATAGSIIGAFFTGYYFIPAIGINATFLLVSLLTAFAAIIAYIKLGIPSLLLVGLLSFFNSHYTVSLYGKVLYQTDTPYYHLEVVNYSGNLSLVTDLSLQTVLYRNITSAYSYYKFQKLVYDSGHGINNALYLGLGGGAMVSDLYRNSNAGIDVVELDPGVIAATERFFNITPNNRLRVYNTDGRFFLKNSTRKYDMIVLDAYGSFSIPYQLVTEEAAQEMYTHLTPNGRVFINVLSPFSGPGSAPFKSLYKTFGSVFPNLYVFPLRGTDPLVLQNIVVIASKDTQRCSEECFLNKLNGTLGVGYSEDLLRYYYQGSVNVSGYPMLTDNKNPYDFYAASMLSNYVYT